MAMNFKRSGSIAGVGVLLLAAAGCSVDATPEEQRAEVGTTTQAVDGLCLSWCESNWRQYSLTCEIPGSHIGNVTCYQQADAEYEHCVSTCWWPIWEDPPPPPPPPPPPVYSDATGTLTRVLSSGDFEVSDVRSLPNAIDSVVTFGFSASARYGFAAHFGGQCPGGFVQLTSASFQSLGGSSLCVETSPTANDPWLRSQATQYFLDITANPSSAGSALPSLRDAIESVLEGVLEYLVTGVVCRTGEDSRVTFCLRNQGNVDVPRPGPCPIVPDAAFHNACVNRGNQTPVGCGVIACIEPLSALGVAGCIDAVRGNSIHPATALAASTFCALIAKRDHLYTAPRSGSVEICSTTQPGCTRQFVVQTLMADVRRQAPYVLAGRPSGGIARPLLTSPLAIDPARLYYLGGYVELMGFSIPTNTSNPITVSVPNGPRIAAINVADQDHLLVGTAESHIFQEGTSIRSLVVGRGNDTRFALLNELVGPSALGMAQKELRSAVQSALAAGAFGGPTSRQACLNAANRLCTECRGCSDCIHAQQDCMQMP